MKRINGFSLMEMMIVLMIVAIVMAASAPMITKKTARTNSSPWIWNGNNIQFNQMEDNSRTAIIGDNNNGNLNSRLHIQTRDFNTPQITFGSAAPDSVNMRLVAGSGGNIWLSNADLSTRNLKNAIVLGNNIALQGGVTANPNSSLIAIGNNRTLNNTNAIVIGSYPEGSSTDIGANSVSIGNRTRANGTNAIAIGTPQPLPPSNTSIRGAEAIGNNSIAIGSGAQANAGNSVAIGRLAVASDPNTIVLGNSDTTVIIPGALKVGKNTVLGYSGTGYRTFISHKTVDKDNWHIKSIAVNQGKNDDFCWGEDLTKGFDLLKTYYSDRRLKNVGKAFTGGLAEVKKLEVFNYTFKDDKSKTPCVGVMAQDLQKVFPKAVTKGDDGYLRIRMEDMFYAVVNAVKELDGRVSKNSKRIEELEKQNKELEKLNKEFKKQNEELLKRLEALEKAKR